MEDGSTSTSSTMAWGRAAGGVDDRSYTTSRWCSPSGDDRIGDDGGGGSSRIVVVIVVRIVSS